MANNSDTSGSSYLYDYGTSPNTRVAISQKVRLKTHMYGSTSPAKTQLGVVSSFSPSFSKSVEPVRGIGFGDKVAELVPGVTEPETASFERALLYLCNLWQATGYAAGADGPVRSLRHHKWPFDVEQQLVHSTLTDMDYGAANVGTESGWNGASTQSSIVSDWNPPVTPSPSGHVGGPFPVTNAGHTATITIYEACWFTSWSATFSQDSGTIMESGDITISDVHDGGTIYGEFLATGNDPSLKQNSSMRYNPKLAYSAPLLP